MDGSWQKDVDLSNYHGVGRNYKGKGVGNTYLKKPYCSYIIGARQFNKLLK
jgi:hypothetical protein